ncbi:hypothetical protein ACHAXA_003075 [Cyclostephanos tholiformis]|uniref:Uncharacterized protein n=1 Tax=Cyclostephanos tholiformis TaxID=382380 RepID=A0ABD3RF01_9STRA
MPSSPAPMAKEVDYYLNPTELFRWINYRRWDGAKSRAISHPEECSTWIVSRHNTDGRILWRHLPLHLICMQKEAACSVSDECDITAVLASRQMEHLMDVLLDAYPEGASSPDDQGMLPLHLLLNKAEGEPNERCINLLLASFPNAVDIRDKFGRTPNDILRESSDSGGMQTSDRCRAAFRALKRARHVTDKITATIRSESASIVSQIKHESSNERSASQQIIVRLEEELSRCQQEIDARDNRERDVRQDIQSTKEELFNMESRLKDVVKDLEVTRKERDELLSVNETLRSQSGGYNEIIERVREEADEKRQRDLETIANLKSEVSTSKAVMEALESQLRSRFTNEDYLSTTVSDLEEQLEELKVRHEHAVKKHQHEMDALAADNKKLKWNADELTKKNAHLHDKLKELNKQMSSIISSYSALNSEHDRLLELSQTYESSLLDSIRSERSKMVDHFNKERATLEKSFLEQERILEESLQCQDKLIANVRSERTRGRSTVEKLRSEFQQLRAAAAERERMIHLEDLAASRKSKRNSENSENKALLAPSTSSSMSESRDPHPSRSHHRSSRPSAVHSTNASVSTSEGHLVRLLDERAAAQSKPSRVVIPGHSMSISSTANSSAQPMPRNKVTPPRNDPGGQYPLQSPARREGERGRGGAVIEGGISKSASNATYASRPGGCYSLEQYSHDASDTSSLYSKSSRTTYTDGSDPSYHHPQQQQQHSWRQNDYRRNLPHVNELNSYDESAQE